MNIQLLTTGNRKEKQETKKKREKEKRKREMVRKECNNYS